MKTCTKDKTVDCIRERHHATDNPPVRPPDTIIVDTRDLCLRFIRIQADRHSVRIKEYRADFPPSE